MALVQSSMPAQLCNLNNQVQRPHLGFLRVESECIAALNQLSQTFLLKLIYPSKYLITVLIITEDFTDRKIWNSRIETLKNLEQ